MNRRNFLKKSAAAGTLVGVGSFGLLSFTAEEKRKHITILHTNDTHSHIEPFGADHPEYPNMGGVSRRYSL
ncbi:MAG TPA: twin-arginine translocation signal domain-containing protein, partial [Salinimicrobium catena]|nr:twin-arginine translocation signal domain-containing protein [Salinimicrobium catena]